ncbi:coenzyme F420-0:L-glutamate ligase [bacterium]|jgi:coenzyme F420-0:L-glutamate ligase/coenzyme F420-1:gamma-L-glutamate ligase|nr:coenzyme F420-0:L-glutamate ligase [bacterium]|tara:strand:- start:145 stop:882 length:738 start_codon:yes stop_codon:yes gene_type:complete
MNLIPLTGIPKVKPGDEISTFIIKSIKRKKIKISKNDLIVIAHKIVSISENRFVELNKVKVGKRAISLSKKIDKSKEFCQLILDNSKKIIKIKKGVIITENRLGIITANAGIDQSNINKKDFCLLLPLNPNATARKISQAIYQETGKKLGIIISDSVGRPWRHGLTQISIGSFGISPIKKYKKDLFKNNLYDTEVPIVDEIASAAGILMEKDIGIPVVLIKGYNYMKSNKDSNILLRSGENDIFK